MFENITKSPPYWQRNALALTQLVISKAYSNTQSGGTDYWLFCYTGSHIVNVEAASDIDLVLYNNAGNEDRLLISMGFELSSHDDPDNEAYENSSLKACYRDTTGKVNIIVPATRWDFDNWKRASKWLCYLQLKEKHQRVALFQLMTEGKLREGELSNDWFVRPHISEDANH